MINFLKEKLLYTTPIKENFLIGCSRGATLFLKLHIPLAILNQVRPQLIHTLSQTLIITRISPPFLTSVLITPLVEELLFRGVLQSSLKKIVYYSIKQLSLTNEEKSGKIAYEISRIAASALFGASHLINGTPFQAINAGLGAFFGQAELMEKVGLTAAVGCHVTNNLIVWCLKRAL